MELNKRISIHTSKLPIRTKGFSVVELTIVIGLVALLSLALSAVMLTTLANSTRIRMATSAKQTGDYALGQMQELIRNAKAVTSCNTLGNTITVTNPDGGNTTFASSGTTIASNSASLTGSDMSIANFVLSCNPSDASPSLVTIAFDVQPTANTYSLQPIHFTTSIQVRNQ